MPDTNEIVMRRINDYIVLGIALEEAQPGDVIRVRLNTYDNPLLEVVNGHLPENLDYLPIERLTLKSE